MLTSPFGAGIAASMACRCGGISSGRNQYGRLANNAAQVLEPILLRVLYHPIAGDRAKSGGLCSRQAVHQPHDGGAVDVAPQDVDLVVAVKIAGSNDCPVIGYRSKSACLC